MITTTKDKQCNPHTFQTGVKTVTSDIVSMIGVTGVTAVRLAKAQISKRQPFNGPGQKHIHWNLI